MLNKLFKNEKLPSLELCGIKIPFDSETLHWLITGSTGTGKTTLQDQLMNQIVERGDRIIVIDPNGHSMSRWLQNSDTILNPFDSRSSGWSIFNEARAPYDFPRLAKSMISSGHGSDKIWNGYAQNLLAQTMSALIKRGENNTVQLLNWLTIVPTTQLKELLTGTSASGLFDPDASKALASTKFVISHFLAAHEFLLPGNFSLTNWLHESNGNLFISWREDMNEMLKPLVSCWVDVLCNAVLSLPANSNRRVWILLDELGALGPITSLVSALTRGRKHGLCVWACLQSTAQLDHLYGREKAVILQSCFRNLMVLGIAKSDPDTAEKMSKSLGEHEVDRQQLSRNSGPAGITKGITSQRVSERLVLASEITSLPNLEGYLALAGAKPIHQIRISPKNFPPVVPSILEEK